jgi:hypothetical protein
VSIELPPHFLGRPRPRPSRGWFAALYCSLALFCLVQLTGLPGSQIRRYRPPADFPWAGCGLREVFIDAQGNWVINRFGYADRCCRYEFSDLVSLSSYPDMDLVAGKTDVSGIPHGGTPVLSWHAKVKIKGSPSFHDWNKSLKDGRTQASAASQHDAVAEQSPVLSRIPWYVRSADEAMQAEGSYVPLAVYPARATSGSESGSLLPILSGHHYYPVFDSWALVEPDLWLTTDRLRFLHRIRLTPDGDGVATSEPTSVEMQLNSAVDRSCVLGVDPPTKRLFILLANGQRHWFDPQTLAPLGSEQLPGCWEAEYAELAAGSTQYSFDLGWALTKLGYQRIKAALMVVFLASLLGLAALGRQAWKSTAAATTAAPGSSGTSSAT